MLLRKLGFFIYVRRKEKLFSFIKMCNIIKLILVIILVYMIVVENLLI